MEKVSFLFQKIFQGFLDNIEELIVDFESFECESRSELIAVLFYIHGILCLFHDHFPFVVDLSEHSRLFGKIFESKRRAEDGFEINPVPLMEVPLVDEILHVSEHFGLSFDPLFERGDILRGKNIVDN